VEHDPGEILDAATATLVEVGRWIAARHEPVAAIGLTNQRETVVAWDLRDGVAAAPAIVWQDRRTAERCRELERAGALPEVRARTGLVLDPYFSATKMAWFLDQPLLRDLGRRGHLALATVDTWLTWNLTGGPEGGVYTTDPTNASRTMLFDIVERRWSAELCELFEIPPGCLAEVRPTCGRVASISPALAGASGIGPVPLSAVAGDQQSALFGQCCFTAGTAKVTYGTGSFTLANCGPEPPPPPAGLLVSVGWDLGGHGGSLPDVTYVLEGASFVSGAAIGWLQDRLGIIGEASDIGPLACSVDGSNGLRVVPAFSGLGSPWWDPSARGAIVGITRGTGRAHLARAVVEAMAFQVRGTVEAMETAMGHPLDELRADGGAAVIDLLLETQSDLLGIPVVRAATGESTALGAATLAGLAEGTWDTPADLASRWQMERRFRPGPGARTAGQEYRQWLAALERSRHWVRE